MRAYSLDRRERVLADCDRGLTTRAVATKDTVIESWVRRLKQRRRQAGEITPRTAAPGPRPSWRAYGERRRQAIAEIPDPTLAELRDRLGLTAALSTLWGRLRRWTCAEKVARAAEPERPDVRAKRGQCRAG